MDILSNLSKSIKETMEVKGIRAPALANVLGCNRSTLTRYTAGTSTPNLELFIKLIQYFGVSADVMLGLKEYVRETEFLEALPFGERLVCVLKEYGVTQYALIKKTGLSWALLYKWTHNQGLPSVENVAKIAQALDCRVDYLLGRIR